MISIKLRTLDSKYHDFTVKDDITVHQFKVHIAANIGMETEIQRLICDGVVLNDDKYLRDYVVNNDFVLKLNVDCELGDVTQQELESFISYGDKSEADKLNALRQVQTLKKFGLINNFVEAREFIESENIFASPRSLQFLKNWCIKLHRQKESKMLFNVANQSVCLQKIDSLESANNFFKKIHSDGCYILTFHEEVLKYTKKIESEAADQELTEQQQYLQTFGFIEVGHSKDFLLDHLDLINEKSLQYLKDWSLQLCRDGRNDELEKVAFQYISMKQILSEANEGSDRVQKFYELLTSYDATSEGALLKQKFSDFIDELKANVSEPGYCKWLYRRYNLLIIGGFFALITIWIIFFFCRQMPTK